MIVIPALDLLEGQPVRLMQGDRDAVTRYSVDFAEMFAGYHRAGIRRLHLVDLDAAFSGERQPAMHSVLELAVKTGLEVQVAGGIRSFEDAEAVFHAGAARVVVGTLAVRDPEVTRRICQVFSGRTIVAVDAKKDSVAISGWTETTSVTPLELGHSASSWGAGELLFTQVERDGTGVGVDVKATAALQEAVGLPVIASGGVGGLEDVAACAQAGIFGVVIGRALLEGKFSIKEAIAQC